MTHQSNPLSTPQTYQERFIEACKTTEPERLEQPGRHIAYSVHVTSLGQKHMVDGPFMTHEEAAISAEIFRRKCRNARATGFQQQEHPEYTAELFQLCQVSRAQLRATLAVDGAETAV